MKKGQSHLSKKLGSQQFVFKKFKPQYNLTLILCITQWGNFKIFCSKMEQYNFGITTQRVTLKHAKTLTTIMNFKISGVF